MMPSHDHEAIDALFNNEELRKWHYLDQGTVIRSKSLLETGKALFFGDDNGGFFLLDLGDGLWDIHTQFLPKFRGPRVPVLAMKMLRYMFEQTPCELISTFVGHENSPARDLALAMGFERHKECELFGHAGLVYVLSIKKWVQSCL
jgi:hypothetical protein